jgi:hypothetical protein
VTTDRGLALVVAAVAVVLVVAAVTKQFRVKLFEIAV